MDVVEGGVGPARVMDGDKLQRILALCLLFPVGKGFFVAFGCRFVFGYRVFAVETNHPDKVGEGR
jgi:hypothetical protein